MLCKYILLNKIRANYNLIIQQPVNPKGTKNLKSTFNNMGKKQDIGSPSRKISHETTSSESEKTQGMMNNYRNGARQLKGNLNQKLNMSFEVNKIKPYEDKLNASVCQSNKTRVVPKRHESDTKNSHVFSKKLLRRSTAMNEIVVSHKVKDNCTLPPM